MPSGYNITYMPKASKMDFAQNALRVVEQSTGEKLSIKSDTVPKVVRRGKRSSVKSGTPGKDLNLRPPAGNG